MRFNKVTEKMKSFLLLVISFLSLSGCVLLGETKSQERDLDSETVVEMGKACLTDFGDVPSGGSFVAYLEPQVPTGQTCQSEVRVCQDGKLSGSYAFVSCFEGQPFFGNEGDVPVVLPTE